METRILDWDDVQGLLAGLSDRLGEGSVVWGVPRGGSHVASMLSVRGVRVALSPVEATVAVDDVIDTGRTAERVLDRYGIETLALVTRHEGEPYYLFPWERAELDAGLDADARDHVTRLLLLLGDEPQRAELQQTPDRVVESWKTLFAGYRPEWADLKATLNWFSERTPEMIVVRDISFLSTCEEHLLPFFGTVGVAYLPNDHALGESKLHQIVSVVSRKLQSQQRMTREIGEVLFDAERTRGVAVRSRATHLCFAALGAEREGVTVEETWLSGAFETDPKTRSRFLEATGWSTGAFGGGTSA